MVRLENVSVGYNGFPVLRELNLRVVPGEMLGVIGPNASGKSTLVRAISGVLKPLSGRIFLDGREIGKFRTEELARLVAVVPQNLNLPPAFTAFELVLMGRTPHLPFLRQESRRDFEIAWRAMELTRTEQLAGRRVGKLSGGERRRLVIARALAQEPKLLLLDEPTAYLDLSHQLEILELVKNLSQRKNLTVIVVLHDLNLAASYCERLIMLSRGRLYTEGGPDEVVTMENIKKVYGVEVLVQPHPQSGLPVVVGPVFKVDREA